MISKMLDWFSEYLAHRKGLLPLIGIALVIINYVLQFFFPSGLWLTDTNLLLHLGVILAIFGMRLAWAL
jgi:uncharacterized protein YqfA (UPF0365 family)